MLQLKGCGLGTELKTIKKNGYVRRSGGNRSEALERPGSVAESLFAEVQT